MDEFPSAEEALAYGAGYQAGLDAAKDQDAAKLVKELERTKVELALERALRHVVERRLDEVRGVCAELEARNVR